MKKKKRLESREKRLERIAGTLGREESEERFVNCNEKRNKHSCIGKREIRK
jgi:hypothetical protein